MSAENCLRGSSYKISLQPSQVSVNKTSPERPLDLFKPETMSSRDDDEPEGALDVALAGNN